MSTILNTLKKLEEEKSVLEKNIDLKGLLLQGQESVYPQEAERVSKNWRTFSGLLIGGVLLGGLIVYLYSFSKPATPESQTSFVPRKAPASPEITEIIKKTTPSPGFPLARIPEDTETEPSDPFKDDFFEPENTIPLPVETTPPAIFDPEPVGMEEIREIETLIQTATESSGIESEGIDQIVSIAPSNSQAIPGLKVKGIIFLNSDNPVNHIFVSTPSEPNRKLKVGEGVLNATLESIEGQKAVFSYQGQRVEKGIGE